MGKNKELLKREGGGYARYLLLDWPLYFYEFESFRKSEEWVLDRLRACDLDWENHKINFIKKVQKNSNKTLVYCRMAIIKEDGYERNYIDRTFRERAIDEGIHGLVLQKKKSREALFQAVGEFDPAGMDANGVEVVEAPASSRFEGEVIEVLRNIESLVKGIETGLNSRRSPPNGVVELSSRRSTPASSVMKRDLEEWRALAREELEQGEGNYAAFYRRKSLYRAPKDVREEIKKLFVKK